MNRNLRRAIVAAGVGSAALLFGLLFITVKERRTRNVGDPREAEVHFRTATLRAAQAARDFLRWMEMAGERLAPERAADLATEATRVYANALHTARDALDANPPPPALEPFANQLNTAFEHTEQAFELFASLVDAPFPSGIRQVLGALHYAARAQEAFYRLRNELPPFENYWLLPDTPVPPAHPVQPAAGTPPTGIMHFGAEGHHGGFSLYVPEGYTADHPWPLIMTLHGASGNGRDFLWTWVREAKSLGYLLVAPSSQDTTWGPVDDAGLLEIIQGLEQRYRVAGDRILLTGLSDGATFTLLYGLAHPDVYRALAPLCGVLHPANEALGNLRRARGMPIYLVHGAQDFLFPVERARMARDQLEAAGAVLTYRELPELSHTYPRSENVRILRWFEGLPAKAVN